MEQTNWTGMRKSRVSSFVCACFAFRTKTNGPHDTCGGLAPLRSRRGNWFAWCSLNSTKSFSHESASILFRAMFHAVSRHCKTASVNIRGFGKSGNRFRSLSVFCLIIHFPGTKKAGFCLVQLQVVPARCLQAWILPSHNIIPSLCASPREFIDNALLAGVGRARSSPRTRALNHRQSFQTACPLLVQNCVCKNL